MKVLVISAHPDDETIGAGGTLLRHRDAGDEISWCIVTQAYSPEWSNETIQRHRQQTERVAEYLGVKTMRLCGFPTVKLNTIPTMELVSSIQRVVDEVRPEVVYSTSAIDINLDHVIVHQATLVATRPLPGSSVRRLLSYEIASTSRFGVPGFQPTVYVDITDYLDRKLEMMSFYETELKAYPHPRSLEALRLSALERGVGVGLGAAEAFQLIRELV